MSAALWAETERPSTVFYLPRLLILLSPNQESQARPGQVKFGLGKKIKSGCQAADVRSLNQLRAFWHDQNHMGDEGLRDIQYFYTIVIAVDVVAVVVIEAGLVSTLAAV